MQLFVRVKGFRFLLCGKALGDIFRNIGGNPDLHDEVMDAVTFFSLS